MSESTAIEKITVGDILYKPQDQDPLALAQKKREIITTFVSSQMISEVDYGVIPGTNNKPVLFKQGAEKLLNLFLLSPQLECLETSIQDWDGGFFSFDYRATIRDRTKYIVGQCDANCNNKEKKYRYRYVDSRWATPEQKANGVLFKAKKSDQSDKYRIENDEPFELVNTIRKMAEKRALVGAALIACGASQFFQNMSTEIEAMGVTDEGTIDAEIVTESSDVISEAQTKRLFAIATNQGKYTKYGLKAMVANFGFESSKDITKDKYEEICAQAESPESGANWNRNAENSGK